MGNIDDDRSRRRRALGKGLGALIPKADTAGEASPRQYLTLPLERIFAAPNQPRLEFDDERLAELAESIQESGLIQPLVVRERLGRYELIAGERRLRASRIAGLKEVPVVIKDVSDLEAYTLALIENIQREDLNPVEEAMAYQKLLEEGQMSQSDLANRVGKSRSALTNSLRLLDLPDEILQMLASAQLSAGHARALVTLPADQALELAQKIIAQGWSVRRTEEEVRLLKSESAQDEPEKPRRTPYRDDALVRDMTDRLQRSLGTRVKLKDRDGKGKIEIYYDHIDVLQSVLDQILKDE